MKFDLKKSERIHHRDEIQMLFTKGKTFVDFPFRVIYLSVPKETEAVKIAVSIPKKKIKKAVDRNLLKRRTKEAYRLNKHSLKSAIAKQEFTLLIMFIFQSKEILPFMEIQDKINRILLRLEKLYGKTD
ncbi:MAG: ribonuclease P protein component [Bacteroidetes bacterium]|nr:MAG: ribonuclease P protein component [Bacteroidota bacterium]MBL1143914.1 ribonuclease P protein component [Bacteroidota bacterium]MCB0804079.1 ribonuclease P protein component [Flavobacteriales bacterium]NOG56715.1 ribonuclease P protein component [Bacteroidota bacterium]